MSSLYLIWLSTSKVCSISLRKFSWALLSGLGWRFTLILGYVFSLHAVGLAFSSTGSLDFPIDMNFDLGLDKDQMFSLITASVFGMFLLSAILDLLYVKARIAFELTVEIDLTRKLSSFSSPEFTQVTYKRKSYCSQILLKCFDIAYSACLILLSVVVIALISIKLSVVLMAITLLAGLVMLGQKTSFREEIDAFSPNSAPRRIRSQKILRSTKVRATTTVMAGAFLALLVYAIEQNFLSGLSLVELAAVAFCTRFFVSFFTMFYNNVNAISDSKVLFEEYLALNEKLEDI